MERLVSEEILQSLDFSDFDVCIVCIKGKQTKQKRLGSNRSLDVLELIHTDISGPFPKASWNGQRYFISFIDDYSRYGYLYLIEEKSEALDMLAYILNRVPIKATAKTPYELWTGRKPALGHFHIW